MMRTDREIGLYVHLPFCIRKCAYCDFYSGNFYEYADRYIDALLKEANRYAKEYKNLKISTLYFGGGTPSSLSSEQLFRLISGLFRVFDFSDNAEITLEANPATLDEEKLSVLQKNDVNRLSIGAQSCQEKELSVLGRLHGYEDFLETYALACRYFDNISLDMMFGLPEQTVEGFRDSLEKIVRLSPQHISLYALKIEEGTRFYEKRNSLSLPSEDDVSDMYLLANDYLTQMGYLQYEISNYAKQGSLSKHNLAYWQGKEYIGLGAAAHSYFDGVRYANSPDISAYITAMERDKLPPKSELTVLSDAERLTERIMLSLRLTEGLDCDKLLREFHYDIRSKNEKFLHTCIQEGYMIFSDHKLSFTPKGFLVSNSILSELIP